MCSFANNLVEIVPIHSEATDKEIAEKLVDVMPEAADLMVKWFAERFPEDAPAAKYAQSDRAFAVGILVALFQRIKADGPPLFEPQYLVIAKSLEGILLPRLPYQGLPAILAIEVAQGMLQEPEAQPLRREVEEGVFDAEFRELLNKTPPTTMHAAIEAMNPEAALAVVVGVHFWWAHRDLLPEDIEYALEPKPFRLKHFFNLIGNKETEKI